MKVVSWVHSFSILCSANKKDIWFADLSVYGESDGTILSKQGY